MNQSGHGPSPSLGFASQSSRETNTTMTTTATTPNAISTFIGQSSNWGRLNQYRGAPTMLNQNPPPTLVGAR